MPFRRLLADHPLAVALGFEAALVPVALALAWAFGLAPWRDLMPTAATVPGAVAATALLLAALAPAAWRRPPWFRAIERLVRPLIEMLFRRSGVTAVLAVSALAGLGEELLMRGVVQAGLAGPLGPMAAIAVASVAFGALHYLSHVYFVLATVMGLYLGVLYYTTGDLLLVALVHALYDAVAIGYLLYGPPRQEGACERG